MDSHKNQSNSQATASITAKPTTNSCRKKKTEDASFLEDLRDHIDEFVHASMDEHKQCFKKSMKKLFGMSKVVAGTSPDNNEVESVLPLKTISE